MKARAICLASLLPALVSGGMLALLSPNSEAFKLETLIMPGRVIESHAQIEEDCANCHERTDAESQNELCLVCHIEVRDDITASMGFHGRHPEAEENLCSNCHIEHEGRQADITERELSVFEHVYADFGLRGKHRELGCADCHDSNARAREAPSQCVACHADDDAHAGALGSSCNGCHSETAWSQTSFDHAMFPLTGAHGQAICTDCHVDQTFAATPTQCFDCHRSDDAHSGRNGADCGACHDAVAWNQPVFDHLSSTGFSLLGRHAALACESCHVVNLSAALATGCVGCHADEDAHQGLLGNECAGCHTPNVWLETGFDHEIATSFALHGAHADLSCTTCHDQGVDMALGRECTSCHEKDPHLGQLGGQCAGCHSELGWLAAIRFDHGLASFPLLGAHDTLACDHCHLTAAFHDAETACIDCHSGDDAHAGVFGTACSDCHNPVNWQASSFDHEQHSGFALEAAHAYLSCASCHRRSVGTMAGEADNCAQCHRNDDPHLGRFGRDCGSCHSGESFLDIKGP